MGGWIERKKRIGRVLCRRRNGNMGQRKVLVYISGLAPPLWESFGYNPRQERYTRTMIIKLFVCLWVSGLQRRHQAGTNVGNADPKYTRTRRIPGRWDAFESWTLFGRCELTNRCNHRGIYRRPRLYSKTNTVAAESSHPQNPGYRSSNRYVNARWTPTRIS